MLKKSKRLWIKRLGEMCLGIWVAALSLEGAVVINEIHYKPDVKTELVEFIELYNFGNEEVDLAGWEFSDGIRFVFPPGTKLPPDGYLVVTENREHFANKFGVPALGPYEGKLSNSGERVVLRDANGKIRDEVTYGAGFPWPIVGEAPGYSIELLHPGLDNDLGGSWRPSARGNPSVQEEVFIPAGSNWNYFKGVREPSAPATGWRQLSFDDIGWLTGKAPVGYGENFLGTVLSDMRGSYSSVYFRKEFVVEDPGRISNLIVDALYDDGFKLWINGWNVINANISAGEVPFNGVANSAIENLNFVSFPLGSPGDYLVAGTNLLAVQAHNSSLSGSSDFFLDARLRGELGPASRGPTPGARNSVYETNSAPQMRQVKHMPREPRSGEPVRIEVKATDPDGVASVMLRYQLVDPGKYIELGEPAYETDWTTIPMIASGGDVFTADLPGTMQTHRRLVRYRITAVDAGGRSVTAPYPEDGQPNFAYFVYDGVPGWQGAARPGVTPVLSIEGEEMGRLPVYHLIAKKNSVETATWRSRYGGNEYRWKGTLVYDGRVYDHIRYRARGGVWRYAMGKNMWKFDLNTGHEFEARDNWGKQYGKSWSKLNLGASIQQGDYLHRGEQGMFESVGFRLFNLAGVEAPRTTFVSFRVIDDELEADAGNQYEGDFWGVYLAVEQVGGRFLDEHGLPDGNLYKMENGTGPPGAAGEKKNQGAKAAPDYSDLITFRNTYLSGAQSDSWWRSHLDLERYYSYQAILQGIHHYDVCCGKNYYYYNNPETGRWQVAPWDLDLTWADNMYVAGVHGGTEPFQSRVLPKPAFNLEFRNRVREARDLLFNEDQAWALIDEYARLLQGRRGIGTILDADRAQWDYNPVMVNSSLVNLSKAGHGRFYQRGTPTKDFAGMVGVMKNYVTYRSAVVLDPMSADALIPATPRIDYAGPAAFPVNRLKFRSSPFQGGGQFASMKWRVAEVTDSNSSSYEPAKPMKYEMEAVWESGELEGFTSEMTVPAAALKVGRTYRARVRMKDHTGRTSHWSPAIQFVAGEPDQAEALREHLQVSEVMYHAIGGTESDYLELHNSSAELTLDLNGVTFTEGIDYTFPNGAVLEPGGYLLVVKATDLAGFRVQYGLDASVPLFGPYAGSLNNSGETVTLKTAAAGTEIFSFTYSAGPGWPMAAAGAGHSLVPLEEVRDRQGTGGLDYGRHWRASGYLGGSPGRADPLIGDALVINEFAANTEANDWIELYNRSGESVVLDGNWYLSDDPAELRRWRIPAGTTAPARGWISFDEVTGFNQPRGSGFALSRSGEQVLLSYLPGTIADRVVDSVRFQGQEENRTLGRYPDGGEYWERLTPTRGAANGLPARSVVISEIMYHPPPIEGTNNVVDEYLELFNPMPQSVAMFGEFGPWRIDDGIRFDFPPELVLGAGERLLLVNFDPSDTVALARFRQVYGLETEFRVLGPYGGNLSNGGERIALELPLGAGEEGEPTVWGLVDEVIYFDQSPWPEEADGGGLSLHRISSRDSGNDPGNWRAGTPRPGGNGAGSAIDSDGDGMPDEWEIAHGFDPHDPSDAHLDADGDGMTNLEEYLSGTDPRDGASFLGIEGIRLDGAGVVLEFTAREDRRYRVEYLESWELEWNLLGEIPEESARRKVEVRDEGGAGERFYRVGVITK